MEVEFSVIIPVYNVEEYLMDAVHSVTDQEYSDYEIILVDDGSTDGSGKICDSIADSNACVTVIHQSNQGLSAARNSGMRVAKGKYIILLDSDDCLSKDSLKNLYEAIINDDYPDFIVSRRETIGATISETIPCKYTFQVEKLKEMSLAAVYSEIQGYPDMWMGAWIFSISRKYIIDNELFFYPGLLHEDEEWVPRVFFSGGTIGYNNSLLYANRQDRSGSITSVPNIKRLLDKLFIVKKLDVDFVYNKYDADIVECINTRKAAIMLGILTDLHTYKKDERFRELMELFDENVSIMWHSKRLMHRIIFLLTKTIGAYNTSRLINVFY